MNIHLAQHHGMCFGVRDALRHTHNLAQDRSVTVLGQLVHNPLVDEHLTTLGVQRAPLDEPGAASSAAVVITAHGASHRHRRAWEEAGHEVFDTTCPLVRKAHRALECLVLGGYYPVVIGQPTHVEVLGLIADHPQAAVISSVEDIAQLPEDEPKLGVVSQTTQPIDRVQSLVEAIRQARPHAEVRFTDTVCQPTKDRQTALAELCAQCDTIVVVGGNNSNNTRQLAEKARQLGCAAYQVERAADLNPRWFSSSQEVGVTAGTSTLDETIHDVVRELRKIAASRKRPDLLDLLKSLR